MKVKEIVCEPCGEEITADKVAKKDEVKVGEVLYTCDDCWQQQYEEYTYNRHLDERGL